MAVVLPLASRIHGEEFISNYIDLIAKVIRNYKEFKFIDKPIYDIKDLPIREGFDISVLIHVTGGTSSLARAITEELKVPVILIAHSKHNSLASALSARAKLCVKGYKVLMKYVDTTEDLRKLFNILSSSLKAWSVLKNLKVLEISDTKATDYVVKKLGINVIRLNYQELEDLIKGISDSEVRDLVSKLSSFGVPIDNYVVKNIKMFEALKRKAKELGCSAITIDCFPYILRFGLTPCLAVALLNSIGLVTACEADYYSLVLMLISKLITGSSGWIGNISGISSEGYLRLSHCTVGLDLCSRDVKLLSHMESKRPYAISCELGLKDVLILRTSLDLSELRAYRASIIRSGYFEDGYCRTQVLLKLKGVSSIEFVNEALGNHHVLIPYSNDVVEVLRVLTWLLNMRFTLK